MTNAILEKPTEQFKNAAASQAKVTLDIDQDIAEYFKSQFKNWQGNINELLRFFMEFSEFKDNQLADFAEQEQNGPAISPPPPAL